MKRFIIHIGQSKTGTTSLQLFLSENRQNLIEQGICYPDVRRGGMALHILNHNSPADSLTGNDRYPGLGAEEYFDQFFQQAEKAGCDTILLSGESFFGGAPQPWDLPAGESLHSIYAKKLKLLKSLLMSRECKVIAYLRRQDAWLESIISHVIRFEGVHSHAIYQSDKQMAETLSDRMDYASWLDMWDEIIKPTELIAVPYQSMAHTKTSIITDFLSRIDQKQENFDVRRYEADENKGLSVEIIELKKKLNQTRRGKSEERTTNVLLNKLDAAIGSGKKYSIDNNLKQSIMTGLSSSNAKLLVRYGDKSTTNFFPLQTTHDEDPVGVSESELSRVEAEYARLRATIFAKLLFFKLEVTRQLRNRLPLLHAMARTAVLFIRKLFLFMKSNLGDKQD